ncbi:hybrid sensor histidine kinase/response regulator [Bythopirellula polymerisocia]|uniref:histidine kinase n=1 Tax=Bythopirellula polymerisocia TaxID=2528003 RepID=A0A5C6D5H6_9BACT|nr:hybrid sensor histidine kinase/response regulator [Bythopirellula polymerisocia]TWU30476.1 Autoinducer 2 sensor kinase/phosphatase LuxQ [Bythopirellula polymerisocia]
MESVDRNNSQQTVAQKNEAAVDRRKDEFIALLAHELRNPLSAVSGALQLLDRSERIPPSAKELYGVIKRQTLLMKTLIDELLDNSRIASGKIFLRKKRLNFATLARHTVADYRHCFEANQLTLETMISPEALWVKGDAVRLSQVMTNLLHNATKFTDPEGTIMVRVEGHGTYAEFSVCDSGIGIEPREVAAMFEPYRQSDSSRVRCKGGLGLGLSLSKRLIEMHEGMINASSEGLGCGSTFTIRLPLALAAPSEFRSPVSKSTVAIPSHRILIVDDRRDARFVLSELLKKLGQEVHEAESGMSALGVVETFRPEIIFCDIDLGDMDGYAVATAIRSNPSLAGVQLVALTGSSGAEYTARALEAGFDRLLTKPISYQKIRDLLLDGCVSSLKHDELKLT